jgi:hypothetical protein
LKQRVRFEKTTRVKPCVCGRKTNRAQSQRPYRIKGLGLVIKPCLGCDGPFVPNRTAAARHAEKNFEHESLLMDEFLQ